MRFPKHFPRTKSQLSFTGDHGQSKPNLSLTLAPQQTGNFLELNGVNKTGGNLFKVDVSGQLTALSGAFFVGVLSNSNNISLNAGGSNQQADVLLNTTSGAAAYSFGYSQLTAQFYLSDNVSRQYFAIAGASGAFTTIGGNVLDSGTGDTIISTSLTVNGGAFSVDSFGYTYVNSLLAMTGGAVIYLNGVGGASSVYGSGAVSYFGDTQHTNNATELIVDDSAQTITTSSGNTLSDVAGNMFVNGNTYTGGTMNAVSGYLINGQQSLQSFSGEQIYAQQNLGGF